MNIREFSHNLQKVYDEMGAAFSEFQARSELPCLSGCGRCCQNPDIEASMMEMIPFALKIFDEGSIDEWIERLEPTPPASCILLVDNKCVSYEERPSVCRMFGVGGYFDKNHEPSLSVCKYIREAYPEKVLKVSNTEVPMMANWFNKLTNLDPQLADRKVPVNEAMLGALKKVAFLAQYQDI